MKISEATIIIIALVLISFVSFVFTVNSENFSATGYAAYEECNLWCKLFSNHYISGEGATDDFWEGETGNPTPPREGGSEGIGEGSTSKTGNCCVCFYSYDPREKFYSDLDFEKLCVDWINNNDCSLGEYMHPISSYGIKRECPNFVPPEGTCNPPDAPLKIAYMGHGNECYGNSIINGVCSACIKTGCDIEFESISCSTFKQTNDNFDFFKNQVDSLPDGAEVTISCNQCTSTISCQPRVVFSYSNNKCEQEYVSCNEIKKTKCADYGAVISCTENDGNVSSILCTQYPKNGEWLSPIPQSCNSILNSDCSPAGSTTSCHLGSGIITSLSCGKDNKWHD